MSPSLAFLSDVLALPGLPALPDADLTGALAEYLHGGWLGSQCDEEQWQSGGLCCYTTSHLTGPVGGCKAHSVANLPSLAPGCGSVASLAKSIITNDCHYFHILSAE